VQRTTLAILLTIIEYYPLYHTLLTLKTMLVIIYPSPMVLMLSAKPIDVPSSSCKLTSQDVNLIVFMCILHSCSVAIVIITAITHYLPYTAVSALLNSAQTYIARIAHCIHLCLGRPRGRDLGEDRGGMDRPPQIFRWRGRRCFYPPNV